MWRIQYGKPGAVFCVYALCLLSGCQAPLTSRWETLADGFELGTFDLTRSESAEKARIIVLRIHPDQWLFELRSRSEVGGANDKSARQWCQGEFYARDSERDSAGDSRGDNRMGIVAATNAGMFNTDYSSHVGYMKSGEHINNPHILEKQYLSAALFGAQTDDAPEFQIVDLDEVNLDSLKDKYRYVIQNLRLIKHPGENRWKRQERKWSEAALAEDSAGNALFVFCRRPFTMFDFNEIILSLPLNIVRAQHLEGGPEAQLFYEVGERRGEFVGSFESGVRDYSNESASPIPNVIVVRWKGSPED